MAASRVKFNEFADAAARIPRMRRTPQGARGTIPSTTLLLANEAGISVDTVAVTSLVPSEPPWRVDVAVDSRRLIAVCDTLKKLGAAGGEIEVGINGRDLLLKYKTTGISIPTVAATKT